MMRLLAIASLVAVPLIAQAQPTKRKQPATASIEGDVYLLNKVGEVKKGAAGTVGLAVPGPKLEALWRSTCYADSVEENSFSAFQDSLRKIEEGGVGVTDLSSTQLQERMAQTRARMARIYAHESSQREKMFAVLIAGSINVPTGMNAHFNFTKVPPGNYFLLSVMHLGELAYAWVMPITVEGGQSLHIDLDNNNAQVITSYYDPDNPHHDNNPFFCERAFPLR